MNRITGNRTTRPAPKRTSEGPAAISRPFKIGEDVEFFVEELRNHKLFESAATASGEGGGTEVADAYVDNMSQTSSPEELETASNNANDVASQGGQGLSDSDLADIDKQAEEDAIRVTNIDLGDPESMTGEELSNAFDMMWDTDEQITENLFDQYEYLIDDDAISETYDEYQARREYLSSEEFEASVSPEYIRSKNTANSLWDSHLSRGWDFKHAIFTIDNVPSWWSGPTPEPGDTYYVAASFWSDTGEEFSASDYRIKNEWVDNWKIREREWNDVVWPEKKKQLDLASGSIY